jgi:Mn2+/Fe2+ NRAMP family transporter
MNYAWRCVFGEGSEDRRAGTPHDQSKDRREKNIPEPATKRQAFGPGFIVAAAFVGPGTVTTATLAGSRYGLTLLWVLVFATLAAIALQEMSARLGLVTRQGLVETLKRRSSLYSTALAWTAGLAVLSGVIAFQAGNLTGAGLGLEAATGIGREIWVLVTAGLAAMMFYTGQYKRLEKLLVACVAAMALLFVLTAIAVQPDVNALFSGALWPSLPASSNSLILILALVGTTLVPYNLFLHARTVQARWPDGSRIREARRDLVTGIAVGGVVSASIVVTASAVMGGSEITNASDMAAQLEPLLGSWARLVFAIGFALAGFTSSITAPLAGAYIVSELRGQDKVWSATARNVAVGCVFLGATIALSGIQPITLIVFAQAANGLILPIVALVLLITLNDRGRLQHHANGVWLNLIGGAVVLVCLGLAARTLTG